MQYHTDMARQWTNGAVSPLDSDEVLERAQELLRRGWLVLQVAKAVGYSSASAFSAAYTNKTGESPAAYYDRVVGD